MTTPTEDPVSKHLLAPNEIEAIHSLVLEDPEVYYGTQQRARLKVRDIGDDMVETTLTILPE